MLNIIQSLKLINKIRIMEPDKYVLERGKKSRTKKRQLKGRKMRVVKEKCIVQVYF